jgi:hypothetical protein
LIDVYLQMNMADAHAVCDAVTRTASRTLRNPSAFISVHQRSLAAYERLIKGSEIGRADAGAPVRYAVHWLIVFYLQMNMADAHAVCDAVTRTASRTLRNPSAFISVYQRSLAAYQRSIKVRG